MKKLFVFAASAMMVFASCTDNEIVYQNETPQEIGLFSVANKMTRAATPTQYAIDGTAFTHANMAVAAYLADGDDGVTTGDYFDKTEFTGSGSSFTGGRYWPIQASTLNFLAVAPEVKVEVDESETMTSGVTTEFGSVAQGDTKASNFASKATVTVANNETNQYDVMYANGTGSKALSATPQSVSMLFNHALAWVNFTFKATSPGITINKVTVNGAKYNGTLTITNTGFDVTTGMTLTPEWSNQSGLAAVEGVVPGKDVIIDNNQTKVLTIEEGETESDIITWGKGLLVVPCTAASFVVNYTVTVDGVSHDYNYTYDVTANLAWVMGKKYNYNISMGLQEIEINPTVTEWPYWTDANDNDRKDPGEEHGKDITIN